MKAVPAPMKTFALSAFFLLAISFVAVAQCAECISIAFQKGDQTPPPKLIQSYENVLSQIPAELRGVKPKAWTRLQREEANAALKDTFAEGETPAKLHLKVVDIADWGGWTFYANMPNHEGYYIRVFGKFTDDWKQKFTALKKGDRVLLKGVLNTVTYRDLWGKFTLSICLKNCTFIKTASVNEPNLAL
jgi:hypothetical protein